MPADEFSSVLVEQLSLLEGVILQRHNIALASLLSELADANRRLEERDPTAWPVPDDPTPLTRGAGMASQGAPAQLARSCTPDKGILLTDAVLRPVSLRTPPPMHERATGSTEDYWRPRSLGLLPLMSERGADGAEDRWRPRSLEMLPAMPQGSARSPEDQWEEEFASEVTAEDQPAVGQGRRFAPREVWLRRSSTAPRKAHTLKRMTASMDLHLEERVAEPKAACARSLMIHPSSRTRIYWSVLSLCFLAYDLVFVPVDVFIGLPNAGFFLAMDWISLTFWFCDVLINFITGVQREGVVEMRPRAVTFTYLRGWFLLDIVLLVSEWITLTLPSMEGFEAISMLRAARFLRLLRILRLMRFSRLLGDLMLFLPDAIVMCMGFIRALFTLGIIIHVMACLWYGVGHQDMSGWVNDLGLVDVSVQRKYIYSVRWSVVQLHGFSPGPLLTEGELLLGAFCSVLGFFVLAVCVCRTGEVLDDTSDKHKAMMHKLCRVYLRNRNVSAELAMRLQRYIGNASNEDGNKKMSLRDRVQHEETMVQELPSILQADLYEEVRRPLLERQQALIVIHANESGLSVLRELCHQALVCEASLTGEVVFSVGDIASRSYLIETGRMIYLQGVMADSQGVLSSTLESASESPRNLKADNGRSARKSTTIDSDATPDGQDDASCLDEVVVERNSHISEVVLWTKWDHCGTLVAQQDSTTLAMNAEIFAKVVSNHESVRQEAKKYVICLLQWMNSLSDNQVFCDLLEIPSQIVAQRDVSTPVHSKDHFIFISHFKKEAGTEATLLEEGLQRLINADLLHPANDFVRPIFLDSQDLADLQRLEKYVRRSHNLVLLLTPGVLTRPWCLLEIITALKHGVEIVPVEICRPGLKFEYPTDSFYDQLCKGKILTPSDEALLKSKGVNRDQLNDVRKVFQKIALTFSPHKSGKIREAELEDILKRCAT